MAPSVAAELRALLGDGVAVAAAAPADAAAGLFPEEARHIAHAGAQRRSQFATVRVCARQALAELGLPPRPLVPAPDGSPRWPDGVVGSLSHTDAMCAAIAAPAAAMLALGVDLELDAPLEPDLQALVCTASERAWIGRHPRRLHGSLGTLVFSAKEAVYKCQYGLTGAVLDFADIAIDADLDAGTFRLVAMKGAPASIAAFRRLQGRFGYAERHLITTAALRPVHGRAHEALDVRSACSLGLDPAG